MAKLVTVRERVHQPHWDSLVRTAGLSAGTVQDRNDLFTNSGNRTPATTNLPSGTSLPSDQSQVILALRCFVWYRNPVLRIEGAGTGEVAWNGDYGSLSPWLVGGSGVGQAPAQEHDVFRIFHQTEEQLHFDFGTGLKNSLTNVQCWYLPAGGGASGDLGGSTDMILLQNTGYDGHGSILRLGRAIMLPPRQNIICVGNIYALPDDGQAGTFGTTQGSRNMLSLRDNLNAIDAMPKCITFVIDGLYSRDVQ
jgi:hypothetical protein